MDGLRDPIGGKPPEIYWRRRIVAAIGAVLVLVVIYFLATSPGGEGDGAATSKPATPTVSADASPDPSALPNGDASRPCTSADVQLTMAANPFTFAGSTLPTFEVAIKNSAATPCLLDTASADTALVVWSGGESNKEMYFSSAYCPDDATVAPKKFLLEASKEEQLSVAWSRQRKGEGCATGDTPAAGYYWAQLTIQGIASEPAQFELAS